MVLRRSLLLQNFQRGRYPDLQLSHIVSHVYEFARDRDGSRFIQMKLDEASESHKCAIYREIKPHLLILMVDQFANFIVQKYIVIGNDEQRQEILLFIQLNFIELCKHPFGCRVVQRAIEHTQFDEESVLLQQFYGETVSYLAKNMHGHRVVQTAFRSATVDVQVIHLIFIYIFFVIASKRGNSRLISEYPIHVSS